MKVSTRTRYGLRLLVFLGGRGNGNIIQVKEIARQEKISPKYLEQIIRPLKKAGLLKVVRGVHGGYALSRDPDTISAREIFDILEDGTAPLNCLEKEGSCDGFKNCSTFEFWEGFHKVIKDYLENVSIGDLVRRQEEKSKSMMFYI